MITSVFNLLACKSKSDPLVIISQNSTCEESAISKEMRSGKFLNNFKNLDKDVFSLNDFQFFRGDLLKNSKVYLRADSKIPPLSKFYFVENNSLTEILCFDRGAEYLSDSIIDVNGDEFLDIVVEHRMSGNLYSKIFLQDPETNNFQMIYDLPNPIFDVHEKIVRGFIKEQSPIVHFYKMRFNRLKIDTLESVFYNTDEENPVYIKTKSKNPFIPNEEGEYTYTINNQEEILKKLPEEYKTLNKLIYQ